MHVHLYMQMMNRLGKCHLIRFGIEASSGDPMCRTKLHSQLLFSSHINMASGSWKKLFLVPLIFLLEYRKWHRSGKQSCDSAAAPNCHMIV